MPRQVREDEPRPHPGPTIHRMPVGGDGAGLLFVAGIILMALVGIPAIRWFLGGAIVVGLVFGVVFRLINRAR